MMAFLILFIFSFLCQYFEKNNTILLHPICKAKRVVPCPSWAKGYIQKIYIFIFLIK